MKKVLKITAIFLLIVLFPLGILYCVGKALFSDKRSFTSYLGMLFLFGLGFCLCLYIFNLDMVMEWLDPFIKWIGGIF